MKYVPVHNLNKAGVSHHFVLPLLAILAVGGIGYYMITMSNAATVPGDRTGVQARRAQDFRDSQGVIVHLDDKDVYTDKDDILASLRYVGINNVRSSISRESDVRTHLAQNGIRFNYTMLTPGNQPLSTKRDLTDKSVTDRASDLLNRPGSGTKYIQTATSQEPYNEYSGKSDKDSDWPTTLANVQKKMWEVGNSSLKTVNPDFKILGPSPIGNTLKNTAKPLQSKNLSRYMDYGNMHSYYGGKTPETSFETSNGIRNGFVVPDSQIPTTSRTLEERLKIYSSRISREKPMVVTEMGYHDWMSSDKDHIPTDARAVGVYMPRAYLENFRIGIVRSYAYELFDERVNSKEYEKHFGMFGTEGRDAPKASAQALHLMNMRLVDDKATSKTFKPGKLDFSFTSKPDDLRYVLLQKSTGKFYLIAWRAQSVYDTKTKQYAEPATPVDAALSFGRSRSVTADYTNGSDDKGSRTVVTKNSKTATIKVSARATVFEIQ